MSPAQQRLAELDALKPSIDKYYEDLDAAIKAVADEHGLNSMFQSPDGLVYKIVKPNGTFISYKDLNYVRTKKADETRGSLSVKEAEAAGFKVKG